MGVQGAYHAYYARYYMPIIIPIMPIIMPTMPICCMLNSSSVVFPTFPGRLMAAVPKTNYAHYYAHYYAYYAHCYYYDCYITIILLLYVIILITIKWLFML